VGSLITDPATLLAFSTRPGVTGSAGQFQPGGDPETIGRAIQAFASDLASGFDLSPGDVKRVHGDARSGYAIEVTKDGQRQAQRKFAPSFSRADESLLGKSAALLGLPGDGWHVRYTGIPATFSERQALIEEYKARAELGITSPIALLAALDDISEQEALRRMSEFFADRARIDALEKQFLTPDSTNVRRDEQPAAARGDDPDQQVQPEDRDDQST
jgi:hypothetical protein